MLFWWNVYNVVWLVFYSYRIVWLDLFFYYFMKDILAFICLLQSLWLEQRLFYCYFSWWNHFGTICKWRHFLISSIGKVNSEIRQYADTVRDFFAIWRAMNNVSLCTQSCHRNFSFQCGLTLIRIKVLEKPGKSAFLLVV